MRIALLKRKKIDNFLITKCHASIQKLKFFKQNNLVHAQTEGHGMLRNLDNIPAVSHGILRTGPQNLAEFTAENCGPY